MLLLVRKQIKLREDFVPGEEFLRDHYRRRDHRQTSVTQLFEFIVEIKLVAAVWTKSERVKSDFSWDVVVSQSEQIGGERIRPASLHSRGFSDEDYDAERVPERRRHLLKMINSRTGDGRVEQKRRACEKRVKISAK